MELLIKHRLSVCKLSFTTYVTLSYRSRLLCCHFSLRERLPGSKRRAINVYTIQIILYVKLFAPAFFSQIIYFNNYELILNFWIVIVERGVINYDKS